MRFWLGLLALVLIWTGPAQADGEETADPVG